MDNSIFSKSLNSFFFFKSLSLLDSQVIKMEHTTATPDLKFTTQSRSSVSCVAFNSSADSLTQKRGATSNVSS